MLRIPGQQNRIWRTFAVWPELKSEPLKQRDSVAQKPNVILPCIPHRTAGKFREEQRVRKLCSVAAHHRIVYGGDV